MFTCCSGKQRQTKFSAAINPLATAPGLPLRNRSTIQERNTTSTKSRNFACPNGLPVLGMALLALHTLTAGTLSRAQALLREHNFFGACCCHATTCFVTYCTLVRLFLADSKPSSVGQSGGNWRTGPPGP